MPIPVVGDCLEELAEERERERAKITSKLCLCRENSLSLPTLLHTKDANNLLFKYIK